MLTTIVRTVVLYIALTACVRFMGKRQIGQLQPAEFVITILISEIISMPIEDPSLPLLNSLISVCLLVCFEIVISVLSMKSERFRKSVQGSAVVVIRKGRLEVEKLRELRFTVDDVLEALRKKDVFDIADVEYAIAETDGSLSVLLKTEKQTVTNEDIGLSGEEAQLPVVVVCDGRKINDPLGGVHFSDGDIQQILRRQDLNEKQIMLMTVTPRGDVSVIRKDEP